MTAREWLAKRAELEAAATEGPWEAPEAVLGVAATTVFGPEYAHVLYHSRDHGTAAWVADARTSAPAMRKALEAVLELHPQEPFEMPNGKTWVRCGRCSHASNRPCPTVAAVEAALGVES